jgi:hypothetical protein
MKKILFILFAVFYAVAFKSMAEGNTLPTANDNIIEGYIIDTTSEEMDVISNSRSLLPPAVRTTSTISIVNNVGKNSTNNYYKQLQSKHNNDTTLSIIHRGRVNVVLSYKNISQATDYYVFFLERIRI